MLNMGELFRYPRVPDVEMARVAPPVASDERAYLQVDDLMFARRSLTLEGAGKCSIVAEVGEPTTWESSIIRARIDPARASAKFLYYYFRSPQGRRQMETIVEQVAAAGIRVSELAKLRVPTPPVPEQQAIAEVLGALDDKIAANTKLAATSLELARAHFLRMRRTTALETTVFADVAEIGGGGTPSTKRDDYWNGDVAWATPTDITALPGPFLNRTARSITEAGLAACASKLYASGAILMTSRATIGAMAIADTPLAVNQGFIVVEPRTEFQRLWLFHEMQSRTDEFVSWANGATFMELSRGNFKKLPVAIPPSEVLANFNRTSEPLFGAVRAVLAENRTLAATRDALLPQLMSGKLRVREAEAVASGVGV